MSTLIYTTSLDGMRTILTKEPVTNDDYVYIEDKLFEDEMTLFKNKKTKNQELDLKIIKIADITLLSEEEQSGFKFNQLYSFNDVVFTSSNRLNKNQIIQLHNNFYLVENIVKHTDKPLELVLADIPFKKAANMYTVLQTDKETGKTTVYDRYSSYSEALGVLWRLREKRNEFFYRF